MLLLLHDMPSEAPVCGSGLFVLAQQPKRSAGCTWVCCCCWTCLLLTTAAAAHFGCCHCLQASIIRESKTEIRVLFPGMSLLGGSRWCHHLFTGEQQLCSVASCMLAKGLARLHSCACTAGPRVCVQLACQLACLLASEKHCPMGASLVTCSCRAWHACKQVSPAGRCTLVPQACVRSCAYCSHQLVASSPACLFTAWPCSCAPQNDL